MAFEFHLPDIGEGLTEATIVRWLVAEGAAVSLDQPIVELETDKAVVEIPAPRAGVVLHHGAPDGAVVPVESLLVVIGQPGESWSAAAPTTPATTRRERPYSAPIVGTLEDLDASPPARPQALPLVRRVAAGLGVDLARVAGTGPGGRITRADVEGAAAGSGNAERVRMSPTRVAIARNLTRSWQEIPHVTTYASADPGAILAERSRLAASGRMPLEALLISAIVPVLGRHPAFNATLDGETLVMWKRYDIGFAVDTPEGLMVAVVRGADRLAVADLAAAILALAGAARARTIKADEMRGATFTLSNIGAVGGGYGTPIIPYGTTAILSVGRATDRAVVRDGAVVAGQEMPLSLSYDHRVIDGAAGRAFLADVVDAIEGLSR
ncbi:MAG: dihydrolipoamide acetyltransferase family protein [Actinomycetota bacterium]